MRFALSAALLSLALGARPAAAQAYEPYATRTYAGCETFLCVVFTANASRRPAGRAPDGFTYRVEFFADVTLRPGAESALRDYTVRGPYLIPGYGGSGDYTGCGARRAYVDPVTGAPVDGYPVSSYVGKPFTFWGQCDADGPPVGFTFVGIDLQLPGPLTGPPVETYRQITLVEVVPEPATLALAAAGAALLGAWAHRRRPPA